MRRQEEVRERHLLEVKVYVHCPKTELNLCKLTEPVGWSRCNGICMAYLPNTVYVPVASSPAVTGSVFIPSFSLILGQCILTA